MCNDVMSDFIFFNDASTKMASSLSKLGNVNITSELYEKFIRVLTVYCALTLHINWVEGKKIV